MQIPEHWKKSLTGVVKKNTFIFYAGDQFEGIFRIACFSPLYAPPAALERGAGPKDSFVVMYCLILPRTFGHQEKTVYSVRRCSYVRATTPSKIRLTI